MKIGVFVFLCDRLRKNAKTLGTYGSDFYAGEPCVTVNEYGKGKALGTQPDEAFLKMFVHKVCEEADVSGTWKKALR